VPAGDGLANSHDYNQATRLLLAKVQVLAIGVRGTSGAQTTAQPAGGLTASAAPAPPDAAAVLVTLAVNQDQAQRLIQAAQSGALYLALLGNTTDVQPGDGVDNYTLFQ
jgi:pilus assembly protein CpaB